MRVKQVEIKSVIPYARNPRKNESAVDKVAASLMEFGWQQPIVVDSEMVVIAGHTRLLAARQLGMKKIPVVIADNLTPEQVKAYRLTDNRVAQEAEWDDELLALEIAELAGLDFDLALTGFNQDELDAFMSLADAVAEGETDEDETPDIPDDPISVLGDVWILGRHRIICGDSTDALVVENLLGGVSPHLMVTDPPYGVEYDPNWRNEADRSSGKPFGARAIGEVLNDDRSDWSDAWALFPGDVAYVWHAGNKAHIVAESLEVTGFDIRAQIIWAKNNIVIGRGHYHPKHEPCWYAVRKTKTGHWAGDRKQSTLWNIDKPTKSETGHSTQKPVEVMRKPIENNSTPGQAVYEPFSGSGTTIIAAEQTGRVCYAIELNPAYVDIAIQRWQDFTGKTAIHEETSASFDKLREKRQAA